MKYAVPYAILIALLLRGGLAAPATFADRWAPALDLPRAPVTQLYLRAKHAAETPSFCAWMMPCRII